MMSMFLKNDVLFMCVLKVLTIKTVTIAETIIKVIKVIGTLDYGYYSLL